MSNISTIATYLARFSGQLQPMLEKVQGMDRRTFLLETAALLALTSCSEPSGKAGMAPMISFKPSGVPVVKRSPRQLLAECNVRPMFMPKSSPQTSIRVDCVSCGSFFIACWRQKSLWR